MLLPLLALNEYLDIKINPEKLAEKLLLSGTKVEEIKKVNQEVVFDLEVTPNRADTLSFYGIAREISTIFGLNLKEPDTDILVNLKKQTKKPDFKVLNKNLCPYYTVVKLDNIRIKSSPEWLQETLKLSGIRPLNNAIDITNLVMLELGQPMHAFDFKKLKGTPTLRASKLGERVITLDNIERKLPEGAIIIEDENGLIDLAGLMGGKNSEISETTEEILLLVPFYNSVAIRKTSQAVGLRTEASNRFEKKLDPNMHVLAANRAIKLFVENANATFGSSILSYGYPQPERFINFDTNLVKQVLGIELKIAEIVDILSALGFWVSAQPLEESTITIKIPSFRPDISLPEDILEEIGRIYGYNNFPKKLPTGEIPIQKEVFDNDFEKEIRQQLVGSGFFETTGYSLVSEADLHKINIEPEKCLKVLHPTSSDFVFLRPSLAINLLKAFAINKKSSDLAFFEIAKEFSSLVDKKTKLPRQNQTLALCSSKGLGEVKSQVDSLLSRFELNVRQEIFEKDTLLSFGVYYSTEGKIVAKVGLISESILKKFAINDPIVFAWFDLEYLSTKPSKNNYQEESKFPSVYEDISFFETRKISAFSVIDFLKKYHTLLVDSWIVDVFQKDKRLSFTVRLKFQDPKQTLTSELVDKIRQKLEKDLVKKFAVVIRKD